LSEHIAKGHRKALVQMATGTGKTRVAMVIIKLLIDANMLDKYLKDQLRRQELNPARLYFSVPASAMPGI
jgi:type I restriction enzyme R subunit